jgi:hypothetical protein
MHPDMSKQQVQKNLQIVPYNLFQIQKKQRQQLNKWKTLTYKHQRYINNYVGQCKNKKN